jgi:hypothetical protein
VAITTAQRAEKLDKEVVARIKGDDFTAGFIMLNDVVVLAAPIIGYMSKERWTRDKVRDYCKTKGWTPEIVKHINKS